LHGDHPRVLIRSLEALGEDCCNLVLAVNAEKECGVVAEDGSDSLLDVKGAGGVHKIEHAHDQRVDQIQLLHPPQVKVNLIERLPDLPQAATTKFAIKIKIFNLLFLLGPQHAILIFIRYIKYVYIN
jgi:hypothetical protein